MNSVVIGILRLRIGFAFAKPMVWRGPGRSRRESVDRRPPSQSACRQPQPLSPAGVL